MYREKRTQAELFDLLAAHKIHEVTQEFHGGGDEGFTEECYAFHEDGADAELPKDLEEEMDTYLWEVLGNGNGPGINGTATWRVPERQLYVDGSEEVWEDFNSIVNADGQMINVRDGERRPN